MTNPNPHGQVPAIQRYKIGYHSDEWGVRSSTPSGIPDASGSWVRYEDRIAALAAGQAVAYMCGASREKELAAQQPGAAYAALPGLFREALAWGMTYGPEIPAQQWDEMRESMVKHYTERASHGQAPAQDANEYLDLLAQCRSAFPIPERGDPLEVHWAAAMADPGEVPGYLQEIAARHAAQAAPAAVAGPVVNRATVIEWLDANDIEVTDRQMDGLFHFAAPTTQPAPNEDEGISREQWIEQAMRVYLIAGDTEQEAEECAKYLWGELDLDDLADPYDAAMSDVEGRGPAPQPSPAVQGDALDAALLDWLNENIFYREMGEWDAKHGHGDGYNMWVLFAPKGVQGSARTIISAARAAQEGE